MAEAAGLAMGGLALASLLSSCVEFLEYLENGKNWTKDFQLALTKVSLLKTRLSQWSTSIEMSTGSFEAHILRERWPEESGAIATTLLGIKEIISSTTRMSKRYDSDKDGHERQWETDNCIWTQEQEQGDRACQSPPLLIAGPSTSSSSPKKQCNSKSSDPREDNLKDRDRPRRRQVIKSFRLQAIWALQDKKRFDNLINDFEFLLHNLERIGDRLQLQGTNNRSKTMTETGTMDKAKVKESEVLDNYPAPTVHGADAENALSSVKITTSSETSVPILDEKNRKSHSPPQFEDGGDPIFASQSQRPKYQYQYQHPLASRGPCRHFYQNNEAYGDSDLFLGDYYSGNAPIGAGGHNFIGNRSHNNSTIHAGNTDANARALIMREKRNGRVKG